MLDYEHVQILILCPSLEARMVETSHKSTRKLLNRVVRLSPMFGYPHFQRESLLLLVECNRHEEEGVQNEREAVLS